MLRLSSLSISCINRPFSRGRASASLGLATAASGRLNECHSSWEYSPSHSIVPLETSAYRRHQHYQVRSYLFLPVSWDEFKERFQRWIESTEQRSLKVRLVSRAWRSSPPNNQSQNQLRLPGRSDAKWNSWFRRQRRNSLISSEYSGYSSGPALPLPTTKRNASNPRITIRSRYQTWKASRQAQYQRLKRTGKDKYYQWKLRQQENYREWKDHRARAWLRTKEILLPEYSEPEWFDELGRPLTARDSTGRFVNPWQSQSTNGVHSVGTILKWRWQRLQRGLALIAGGGGVMPSLSSEKLSSAMETPDPSEGVPPLPSHDEDVLSATWLGHATCWIQMEGFSMLMDPMFSIRASPYQSLPVGVPRSLPASHSIDQLRDHAGGKIDICCISHDHYDHMDKASVQALAPYVQKWVVPLGIGSWLVHKCNIGRDSIIELEWWQQVILSKGADKIVAEVKNAGFADALGESITITCCPASHWAGRTMFDRNKRLWGSFSIASQRKKFFFCGDTGYPENFPLFRQIGDALGPFDLACIPIGAYVPVDLNKDAHVNPAEAVCVHRDILSRQSLAMHYGSFELGEEGIDEPPRELTRVINNLPEAISPFSIIGHGESIEVGESRSDNTSNMSFNNAI